MKSPEIRIRKMLQRIGGEGADNHIIHIFDKTVLGKTKINNSVFEPEELEIFIEPSIRKKYIAFLIKQKIAQLNFQIFIAESSKDEVRSKRKKEVKEFLSKKLAKLHNL